MKWHLEPLGAGVSRELARLGPAAAIGPVVECWPSVVGPAIAANAWPARIARDGTLHVAASSSSWAFELTQLASEIQSRLAGRLGPAAPPRVRFAVGRIPEVGPESETSVRRPVPEVRPGDLEEASRIAAPIAESELRSLVSRAAAASLARARAGPHDR